MRTKIMVTVGPASREEQMLRHLVHEGVRLFRLNFSHGNAASFLPVVEHLRALEGEIQTPVCIIQDLSGPKYRIGELSVQRMEITKGGEYRLGYPRGNDEQDGMIPFLEPDILSDLSPGDRVVVSDGSIEFLIEAKETDHAIRIRAENSGFLLSKKGIAFPGKKLSRSMLTDKDCRDIQEGAALGVDAVALSYVSDASDLDLLRRLLQDAKSTAPIVAKLERGSAVQNLDAILDSSDAVMVARGDLGVECPLYKLPELQKRIIRACNAKGKPVIVATQMLLSMVDNARPTRAETTDVANAVLDGADCVMLSEETAVGKYPLETVRFMHRITRNAEEFLFEQTQAPSPPGDQNDPIRFLAYGACLIAEKSASSGLVAHTKTGQTALLLSSCRPRQTIFALSPSKEVAAFLNVSRGVLPFLVGASIPDHLERAERFVEDSPFFPSGHTVVITAGHTSAGQQHAPTNMIKIYQKRT
ncbi:MAG: pyruvate kinase [Desulfovibrionales bacterium]